MVRTIIEDKTAIINIEKNIISENVDILEERRKWRCCLFLFFKQTIKIII